VKNYSATQKMFICSQNEMKTELGIFQVLEML